MGHFIDVFIVCVFTISWVVSVILATHIGMRRGFPFLGFLNGAILGPLGAFVVVIQRDGRREACAYCAEAILKEAKICPYCRKDVDK